MMIAEEISMIVSSDPNQGAINVSADGSYFEVQLQDGLKIPKEAQSVQMQVDEATVWWNTPNIITGINDKMHITGPSAQITTNNIELGFPSNALVGNSGSTLTITGAGMPIGAFLVGDFFQYDNAPISTGTPFQITAIGTDTATNKSFTLAGAPSALIPAEYNFSRIRNGGVINTYNITIPQGLYDLTGLNLAISTALDLANAVSLPVPLISFSPNNATQRVIISINYPETSVNFSSDTPYLILGFNLGTIIGPYNTANGILEYTDIPRTIEAPNTAEFNQVNYFLVHSDLTNRGIRINNSYDQVVASVLIDVPPGSQIVSRPYNPPKVAVPELAGAIRTYMRFWLTDDSNRRVFTSGEVWSARIVIRYNVPFVIGVSK